MANVGTLNDILSYWDNCCGVVADHTPPGLITTTEHHQVRPVDII